MKREARDRPELVCARFDTLTERELGVLSHFVRRGRNKQIAGDLGIHDGTVKLHGTAI